VDIQKAWAGIEQLRASVLALQVLVASGATVEIRLVQRETGLTVASGLDAGSPASKAVESEILARARTVAAEVAEALKSG